MAHDFSELQKCWEKSKIDKEGQQSRDCCDLINECVPNQDTLIEELSKRVVELEQSSPGETTIIAKVIMYNFGPDNVLDIIYNREQDGKKGWLQVVDNALMLKLACLRVHDIIYGTVEPGGESLATLKTLEKVVARYEIREANVVNVYPGINAMALDCAGSMESAIFGGEINLKAGDVISGVLEQTNNETPVLVSHVLHYTCTKPWWMINNCTAPPLKPDIMADPVCAEDVKDTDTVTDIKAFGGEKDTTLLVKQSSRFFKVNGSSMPRAKPGVLAYNLRNRVPKIERIYK